MHPVDATFCYSFSFVIYALHFNYAEITKQLQVGKTKSKRLIKRNLYVYGTENMEIDLTKTEKGTRAVADSCVHGK
jgi:hypothetical protein